MTFLFCVIAWMAFFSGVITLVYDIYKVTISQANEPKWLPVYRWFWGALMFAVWYYLLFI